MRHLKRFDKPQILLDNEQRWTLAYINSGKDRPNNKQYGHTEIKEALGRISNHKCFYSEVKFAELSEAQVDHFIEVSEDKTKAFSWENLYLSHKDSNMGKPSNRSLPNTNCLDPFVDKDEDIESNLDFEDEIILGLTEKGNNTIQKYNLGKPLYNTLRLKELTKFYKILAEIAIQGRTLDKELKDILKRFSNPEQPFSLMFKKLLLKNGIF